MSNRLPPEYRELLRGPTRRFYIGTFVSAFGTGLVLSQGVIYVRDVRHLSLWFALGLQAFAAVVAFASSPIGGWLTDRLGPIRPMILGVTIAMGGMVIYAFATSETMFVASIVLTSIGGAGLWGPSSVLLTRMVPEESRTNAYGLNFQLLNLGIGFGALVSALFVNIQVPATYTHLYLSNAGLTLLDVIILATLWRYGKAVTGAEQPVSEFEIVEKTIEEEGWREVLRDRRLIRYISAAMVLMICGYGSIESGFSYFIVNVAHLSVHFVGITFFFNTTTIVVAQLFALRYVNGRRRTKVMGLVGTLWALSWLFTASAVLLPKYGALAVLCIATTIFAVGETIWQPVSAALVNELAPEHLRGRYNSAAGLTWTVSGGVAPIVTALFVVFGLGALWPLVVAGGAFGGGLMAVSLRHSLTPKEDGITEVVPAVTA